MTLDVKIRLANSAALGIRGETNSLLTDIPVELHPLNWQVFHPDGTPFKPEDLPLSQAVLYGKTIKNAEAMIRNSNGQDRWVLANASPVRNSQGTVIAGIVVFADITDIKRLEDTLRQSEQKFRTIIEQTNEGFLLVDEDGKIIEWNAAMEKFWGPTKEEVLGKFLYDVQFQMSQDINKTPERYEFIKDTLFECLRTGKSPILSQSLEYEIKKPNNKTIYIIQNIFAIKTEKGYRLGSFHHDDTERKKVENSLINSEERYRKLTEVSPDLIYILDLNGVLLYVNKSAAQTLQSTPEELVGKSQSDIFPSELSSNHKKGLSTVLLTGEIYFDEEVITTPSGDIWLDVRLIPLLDENGSIYSIMGISRNIAERKKSETERLRLQNLESLGILAGGIAHDFNNILTSITGQASIAHLRSNDEDIKRNLSGILNATKRAVSLTQQLLTFAKGGEPQKTVISVRKIIEDTTKFSLSGSNVESDFIFKETLDLFADPGQVSQVIQNIVINAKQSMPSGGRILISTEDTEDHNKQFFVKICIKDSGIGIKKEDLQRIFDPYFTTKQSGSGLGLAVCYSIVKRHGGKMQVDSKIGVGTTFEILLPGIAKSDEIKQVKSDIIIRKLKILIMDDEDGIRDILKEILTELNHTVVESKEGHGAIKIYRDSLETGEPFDLVILDLTIKGGLGGKETVKILRQINPDVKVIVSSGYADSSASNYKDDGFDEKLDKPYTIDEVNEVLFQISK